MAGASLIEQGLAGDALCSHDRQIPSSRALIDSEFASFAVNT
jgi:hypothetical protein